tara:strand:- start:678 stop:1355 length:678 start_codon:yes stop_codon:yes gene_type:complete
MTGAPGSKWSAASWVLSEIPELKVDKGDRTPERLLQHDTRWGNVRHTGVYFGPGNELGKNFHNINTISKDEIFDEIIRAWPVWDPDMTYIIRCHQFIYNIDWMIDTFPESKFCIVTRPPEACYSGWTSVGGPNTPYPHYKEFYKNEEYGKKKLKEEVFLARKTIYEYGLDTHIASLGHFKNKWSLNPLPDTPLDNHIKHLEGYRWDSKDPLMGLKHDVTISYLNF